MPFIDAGKLLPHISPEQFPGQALAVQLYLEGEIRTGEIGSFAFADPDPETGKMVHPKLELVRLAIPRGVYTQSDLDYVAEMLVQTAVKSNLSISMSSDLRVSLKAHFKN
ncbi:hypothetical protein [Pleurocapsa sp. PCC 7319]|uniref:hypothetical protein n=1 Tax=Pleurocapsa sp. PCC 7319 TaxID=118161 RepID=UPI00034DB570|nr:hypothetical protein [Pleurocapsa sp. PCC 7319]